MQPAPTSYDRTRRDTRAERARDALLGLRVLNNEVKRHLIAHAVDELGPGDGGVLSVVDLACGCGGDAAKFDAAARRAGRRLLLHGVDYTPRKIQDAKTRWRSHGAARRIASPSLTPRGGAGGPPPQKTLLWTCVEDAFDAVGATQRMRVDRRVQLNALGARDAPLAAALAATAHDVVSCQMALHYAARSAVSLAAAADAMAALCKPGGVLVLSTTDDLRMVDWADRARGAGSRDPLCSVRWLSPDELLRSQAPAELGPGVPVAFRLGPEDAPLVRDVEWLVDGPALRSALRARGFRCLLWRNFQDLLSSGDDDCLVQHKGPPERLENDWAIAGLYVGALFVRSGEGGAGDEEDETTPALRTPWGTCAAAQPA